MKKTAVTSSTLAAAAVAAAVTLAGCDAPPPTNIDDVLDYVRNAKVGAKVRRLDPAAQAYVDRVFKAFKGWENACAPIETRVDIDALEPIESDAWRKLDRVKISLEAIRESDTDASDTAAEPSKTRAQWLEELRAAIGDVPDLTAADSTTGLADRVEAELDFDQHWDWIGRVGHAFESLYAMIEANATGFDHDKTGLAFASPAVTERVAEVRGRVADFLRDARRVEVAEIEDILSNEPDARDRSLQEKAALRNAGLTHEQDRRRFRHVEMLIHYYDARIKAAEKRQRELVEASRAADSG